MELTHSRAPIPPRTLDPREAAEMLMGGHYLGAIGVSDIPRHALLFNQLINSLPGQCALLCVEASWRWTPDRVKRCWVSPTVGTGRRVFVTMFVPDSSAGRLAMALGAGLASGQRLSAILPQINIDAPILLLDDPQHPGNQALFTGYESVCCALQMVFEGKATDVSLN
jgi:hypothetical protein